MPPDESQAPAAFELVDVCRSAGDSTLLADLNMSIPAGNLTAVIGPSGAGKSSLLRLLNRLDDPSHGVLRYHGTPFEDIPVRELRTRVGFVFQTPIVFPGTVRNNLEVTGAIRMQEHDEIAQRIDESLRYTDLGDDILERDAATLSVGQKQRVCLARAFMHRPETLVLDEPTASLDPETARKLMRTVADSCQSMGITVITATHRLEEAREFSEFVVMLENGRIVETAPSQDVFGKMSNPRVRTFLEGAG